MKRINVISAFLFSICISACTGGNKQKADDYIIVDVTANYPKKEFTLQYLMDVEYIPLETRRWRSNREERFIFKFEELLPFKINKFNNSISSNILNTNRNSYS